MRNILLFVFALFIAYSASATHGAHIEFHYYWQSDSTYDVKAVSFWRCDNPNQPSLLGIQVKSNSRSYTGTLYLSLDSSSYSLPYEDDFFDCANPDSICRKILVYEGTWTSPGPASDWTFSYNLCCRIGGIADLPPYGLENVEYSSFYSEFGINNLSIPDQVAQNISPVWHNPIPSIPGHLNDTLDNLPINMLCQNKAYQINHGATEYQNDSVVYSFYQPQWGSTGDTVSYRLNYTLSDPIVTMTNPLSIDASSGIISLKPGIPLESGFFVIGVKATEYRNNVELGFIQRELTFQITDSVYLGIESPEMNSLKLYPNPSSGQLQLSVTENFNEGTLLIFSYSGELVHSTQINAAETTVSLKDLRNGLYLVKVSLDGKDVLTKRILLRK